MQLYQFVCINRQIGTILLYRERTAWWWHVYGKEQV